MFVLSNYEMETFIDTCEIIWPYRFDLLVRIDFLEWFDKIGRCYLPKFDINSKATSYFFLSNSEFFNRAKQHPYFIQYTKLKRKNRLRNLTYQQASTIYAEGIVNFLKLKESIRSNSFRTKNKITLKKPIFSVGSKSKRIRKQKYYIGDGCHRLACLIWINKNFFIPKKNFKIINKLFYNPANSNLTAGYRLLEVLNEDDIKRFKTIFEGMYPLDFDLTFQWINEIRKKFSRLKIKDMFNIKFNSISFNDHSGNKNQL
jgi:hypothetical protein